MGRVEFRQTGPFAASLLREVPIVMGRPPLRKPLQERRLQPVAQRLRSAYQQIFIGAGTENTAVNGGRTIACYTPNSAQTLGDRGNSRHQHRRADRGAVRQLGSDAPDRQRHRGEYGPRRAVEAVNLLNRTNVSQINAVYGALLMPRPLSAAQSRRPWPARSSSLSISSSEEDSCGSGAQSSS